MKYTYEIILLQSLGCLKHLSLEMFDFFCAFDMFKFKKLGRCL